VALLRKERIMGLDITGIGAIFDFGTKIIDKIFPDKTAADAAKLKMFELQQQGQLSALEQDFKIALEQIKTNAVEAASPSVFVSGWRPAVGWVCACAYAYNYFAMPMIVWGAKWYSGEAPNMIALETSELTTLLFGMLGLGAMRSFDKKVATDATVCK
jgi:hypothetical protein